MQTDFDFTSYISRRKGVASQVGIRLQDYAYLEDIERMRQLSQRDFVRQGLSLGLQAWKLARMRRINANSRLIEADANVSQIWSDVCAKFRHAPLPLRIMPMQDDWIVPWGDDGGTFFTLSPRGYALPTSSMQFIFGRAIGALDNSHVPWMTITQFVDDLTHGIWNKATQIPDILLHWSRCAQITQDRAGILASRDISGAIYVIMKSSLDWGDDEIMRELRRYHNKQDVDWGENEVEKRIRAIEIFMESRIYRRTAGRSMRDIDEAVQELYAIFSVSR